MLYVDTDQVGVFRLVNSQGVQIHLRGRGLRELRGERNEIARYEMRCGEIAILRCDRLILPPSRAALSESVTLLGDLVAGTFRGGVFTAWWGEPGNYYVR